MRMTVERVKTPQLQNIHYETHTSCRNMTCFCVAALWWIVQRDFTAIR